MQRRPKVLAPSGRQTVGTLRRCRDTVVRFKQDGSGRDPAEQATKQGQAAGNPAGNESAADRFVRGKAWAEAVIGLQQDVHSLVDEQLGPLQLQPTKHAADGRLRVEGPGEVKMVLDVTTHSGGAVWHKHLSFGGVPAFKMLYSKTSVSACPELMTPFLELEVAGSEESVLVAGSFAPRLCLLRHLNYMRKYYRSVPPGAPKDLVDMNTLYNRMLDRAQRSTGVVSAGHSSSSPTMPEQHDLLYRIFTSKQLWTRLHGHGALFTFDARDANAWEAVRADTSALVRLWCAWVKADLEHGASAVTDPSLVAEWRDRSRVLMHSMELDEDTARAEKLVGADNLAKIKETVSGVASLAPPPSWQVSKLVL